MTKARNVKKKLCRCRISGIISLYREKNGYDVLIRPEDCTNYWIKFKFCPLCGNRKP